MPHLLGLRRYIAKLEARDVEPGSWAEKLFEAVARGDLSMTEARLAIIDYVAPALDTTILATGHMLWQIGTQPAVWEALRESPTLVPAVVNEAVRLASPIRGFTRYALEPTAIGGSTVPAGGRVLVLFASANRDERRYDNPDLFDIRRDPRDQLGWGHGAHTCAGLHLARLEMEVLLEKLLLRVGRIEADRPVSIHNNVLQGFSRLPARFHAG
jgi:cytochrome P450